MKFIYKSLMVLMLFTSTSNVMALEASKQTLLDQNAQIWADTMMSLYQNKQYSKIKFIEDMGKKDFAKASIWQNPSFVQFWSIWVKRKALLSWEVGNGTVGMWKLSQGESLNRPTLGIKKEQNGQWWIVFVQPQNVGDHINEGWSCSPNCSIQITSNGVTKTVLMRPPQHQEFQKVHTLGAIAQPFLFTNTEQTWDVVFPDNQKFVFDVSFVPSVCRKNFGECF